VKEPRVFCGAHAALPAAITVRDPRNGSPTPNEYNNSISDALQQNGCSAVARLRFEAIGRCSTRRGEADLTSCRNPALAVAVGSKARRFTAHMSA